MNNDSTTKKVGALEVIARPDIAEAILKNAAWYLALGALLKLATELGSSGHYSASIFIVLTFFLLILLNLLYGVHRVLLPIDESLGANIARLIRINASDSNSISQYRRTFIIFCSPKGFAYLLFFVSYLWCGIELTNIVSTNGAANLSDRDKRPQDICISTSPLTTSPLNSGTPPKGDEHKLSDPETQR